MNSIQDLAQSRRRSPANVGLTPFRRQVETDSIPAASTTTNTPSLYKCAGRKEISRRRVCPPPDARTADRPRRLPKISQRRRLDSVENARREKRAGRPATLPSAASFASRPHGTRLRYLSGCKCMKCRAANSRYESSRAAARKRGEGGHLVDAARARRHIKKLGRSGLGYKALAAAADVGKTTVFKIRSGRKKTIRATTERAILAVEPWARADHSLVPAGKTWRLLEALLVEGYTKTSIARELGSSAKVPALQVSKEQILARTAAKVERVYRRLTE